jgi:hypothetical protein
MNKNYINLFTYFPFIGWILPIGFNSRDEFAVNHGKHALVAALFSVIILVTLTIVSLFVPKSYRTMKLVIVIAIYLILTLYFVLCIIGTLMIKDGKMSKFPVIEKFADKLEI